ncbi:MAG: hypothetical protein CSYNP_02774 [Syntrophus sp. SKADARSKE-3]|nr:hypothetical protein [Syntrophus sp. SKADARSKE-3]
MNKTHDACHFYGHQNCPHVNHDLMVRSIQEMMRTCGGKPTLAFSFPGSEEIDKLCSKCPSFKKSEDD